MGFFIKHVLLVIFMTTAHFSPENSSLFININEIQQQSPVNMRPTYKLRQTTIFEILTSSPTSVPSLIHNKHSILDSMYRLINTDNFNLTYLVSYCFCFINNTLSFICYSCNHTQYITYSLHIQRHSKEDGQKRKAQICNQQSSVLV